MKLFKKIKKALYTVKTSIDIRELYNHFNSEQGFSRYDMIVRYLAVEQYYGGNNCGYELYKKMQAIRRNTTSTDFYLDRFIELIESYKGGYDTESRIELSKDLMLIDGSHRFALALYTQNYNVSCIVRPYKLDENPRKHRYEIYDIKWFIVNGFTPEEIAIMEAKNEQIAREHLHTFTCTLWSPAQQYFDEITSHLSLWGKVTSYEDFTLDSSAHSKIVKGVYAVDDIEDWKIEKKLSKMQHKGEHPYKIRVVNLSLPYAKFRLKRKTNGTLSSTGEQIKRIIRTAYKSKIENYFHDIILHIGDNYYQSRYIAELFKYKELDIKALFDSIADVRYVITKFNTPYMPADFPCSYPLGRDVDIVCSSEEDFMKICGTVANLYSAPAPYSLRVVDKSRDITHPHKQYRIEHEGALIFLFDIFCSTDELTTTMVSSRSHHRGYNLPPLQYEILIRLQECNAHPEKIHHLEFIKANISSLDADLCDKYLTFNWRGII